MAGTIFDKIISRQIPADIVYEDDLCLAFRDVNPQAPVHIVVIPKVHSSDIAQLGAQDPALAGELIAAISTLAAQEGLEQGFRVVFNTGSDGGQTVGHVHAHVLAGRSLTWPPG